MGSRGFRAIHVASSGPHRRRRSRARPSSLSRARPATSRAKERAGQTLAAPDGRDCCCCGVRGAPGWLAWARSPQTHRDDDVREGEGRGTRGPRCVQKLAPRLPRVEKFTRRLRRPARSREGRRSCSRTQVGLDRVPAPPCLTVALFLREGPPSTPRASRRARRTVGDTEARGGREVPVRGFSTWTRRGRARRRHRCASCCTERGRGRMGAREPFVVRPPTIARSMSSGARGGAERPAPPPPSNGLSAVSRATTVSHYRPPSSPAAPAGP
jgi:hypothetical protein